MHAETRSPHVVWSRCCYILCILWFACVRLKSSFVPKEIVVTKEYARQPFVHRPRKPTYNSLASTFFHRIIIIVFFLTASTIWYWYTYIPTKGLLRFSWELILTTGQPTKPKAPTGQLPFSLKRGVVVVLVPLLWLCIERGLSLGQTTLLFNLFFLIQ